MTTQTPPRTPIPSPGGRKRVYRIERRFDGSRSIPEMLSGLLAAHMRR